MAPLGPRSGRPSKSLSNVVSPFQLSVLPVVGSQGGQTPGVGPGVTPQVVGRASPLPHIGLATTGDAAAVLDLLVGLSSLVQRFDAGMWASSTPVLALVSYSPGYCDPCARARSGIGGINISGGYIGPRD